VRSADGGVQVVLVAFPLPCREVIPHVAADPGSHAEPAPGLAAGWFAQRAATAGQDVYCRDLPVGSRALAVRASGQAERDRVGAMVRRAIDVALDGPDDARPQPDVTAAGTERVALPGSDLTLTLPAGRYRSDGPMLTAIGGGARFAARTGGRGCDHYLKAIEARTGKVVPAVGVDSDEPTAWGRTRLMMNPLSFAYCRDRPGLGALILTVSTLDPGTLPADLGPITRAIDQALPPAPPVIRDVAGVGVLRLPGARFVIEFAGLHAISREAIEVTTGDGTCAQWRGVATAAGWTFTPATVRSRWLGVLGRSPPKQVPTLPDTVDQAACRDDGPRHILVAIDLDPAVAATAHPLLPELEAAVDGALDAVVATSAAVIVPPVAPAPAPRPRASGGGEVEARPSGPPREPATLASPRLGAAVGSVTPVTPAGAGAPPPATAILLEARLPWQIGYGYGDDGPLYGGALALGVAGGAVIGDLHLDAGYGVAVGPLLLAGMIGLGADRAGGGFDPQASVYLSVTVGGRLAVGSTAALTGEATAAAGSGAAERRLRGGLAFRSRGYVIELGGVWQEWTGYGAMVGGVLAIAR
jgi:hypothetical protein